MQLTIVLNNVTEEYLRIGREMSDGICRETGVQIPHTEHMVINMQRLAEMRPKAYTGIMAGIFTGHAMTEIDKVINDDGKRI